MVEAHRPSAPMGVVAATWVIAVTEAALWLIYGRAIGDTALVADGAS